MTMVGSSWGSAKPPFDPGLSPLAAAHPGPTRGGRTRPEAAVLTDHTEPCRVSDVLLLELRCASVVVQPGPSLTSATLA